MGLRAAEADAARGEPILEAATTQKLDALVPELEPVVNELQKRLSERARGTRERSAAFKACNRTLRDLWHVLNLRVGRLDEPAEVLTYYKLPLDGRLPRESNQQELLVVAEQVVEGDAQAVAAGYAPMVNPSAQELAERIAEARKESAELDAADQAYDELQAQVAQLRAQADLLIDDVMAELRFRLRREEPSSQRRIMRRYGATFRYLRGEPRDPDDPTPEVEAE